MHISRRSFFKGAGIAVAGACLGFAPVMLTGCSSDEEIWYNYEKQNGETYENKLIFHQDNGAYVWWEGRPGALKANLRGDYSVSGTIYTLKPSNDYNKVMGKLVDGDLYLYSRIWHKSENEAMNAYKAGNSMYRSMP